MNKPYLLTFIVLGILLFLVGLLFRIMHWPDMFQGIYSGPAFIIIGLLLYIFSRKNSK